MFWNKKKEDRPEPTEEQLREEADMAYRDEPVQRPSGETTKIVRLTLGAIDRGIQETKATRQAAKKLQESVAQVGAQLRLKKA